MRTMGRAGVGSFVRANAGQRKFQMYTSSPSATIEPVVSMSPPPWDGSAEGYGPPATDYGVFYKQQAPLGGCRSCGMGADESTTNKWLVYGGVALGALLLYKMLKKR